MNNNCDCSGSNVINNLLQNPNNSISNLGTNMGGNVGHGNLGGMDSMGFNLGMDYGNTPPVNNVTNYGNVGNNNGQNYGNNLQQQPSNDGTRSTSINALRNNNSNGTNTLNLDKLVNSNSNSNNNTIKNVVAVKPLLAEPIGGKNVCLAQSAYSVIMVTIGIGIVITAALAWHEAFKYYIGRSIKFNQGNPTYYLYYAGFISVVGVIFFNMFQSYLG